MTDPQKSSLPSRRQPLARSKKPIKRSKYAYEGDLRVKRKKRKPSEFARIYGSKERVEFVKGLPCAACGVRGYSENAHLTPVGEKGTGYKGHYRFIAPLCGPATRKATFHGLELWGEYVGCHKQYDEYRPAFDEAHPDFNPEQVAAQTEKAWKEYSGTSNKDEA